MHTHTSQTDTQHEKTHREVGTFFIEKACTAPAQPLHSGALGSAPGAPLQRLPARPAAPQLRAPRRCLPGRRWHRCKPAAALEGGVRGRAYPRHRPGSRPGSPLKDKPAARRPPAGLGIDDPDPPGCWSVCGHGLWHVQGCMLQEEGDSQPTQESGRRRACRSLGLMRRGPVAGRCGSLVETAVSELSLLISAFRLDENGAIWLAPVATSVGAGRWQGRVRCRRARRHRRCAGHRRPAGPADVGVCVRQVSASRAAAQRRLQQRPLVASRGTDHPAENVGGRDPGVATGCPPLQVNTLPPLPWGTGEASGGCSGTGVGSNFRFVSDLE